MISIIMQGKNDNYLENFIQRLTFCLSKHIDNIKTLGLEKEVQIVLTDWGSDVKLIDVLDVDFSLIKYIYVTPEMAKAYNGEAKYSYVHALNVSARHSDGEFILWGDSDGFLPLQSFKQIYLLIQEMKKLNINKFFWGSRYHIDRKDYKDFKKIKEIDNYLDNLMMTQSFSTLKHDQIDCSNFGGFGGLLLLTKSMYHDSTGMWEKLVHWGWQDVEFHRRLLNKYEFGGDLERIDANVYHLEHWENRGVDPFPFLVNEHFIDAPLFNINGESWGLGNEKLEIVYRN